MVAGQRFRLDAAYPELMIFMEGDGFGVHSQRDPFEIDRSRQNLLVLAGWLPLRFTWRLTCAAPPQRIGAAAPHERHVSCVLVAFSRALKRDARQMR